MKPKEVVDFAKKHDAKFVDLKFIDFPGIWQHTTVPAHRLTEACFEEGFGFDGSSIRGWQPINASDMLITPPDPETALLDPFTANTTISMILLESASSDHRPALLARPPLRREESRSLSSPERDRRRRLLRTRSRVLHL